ncbi:hypothetical protein H5410_043455 [Solanum commersonii]|uniref:Uncharacterized protein n=1 Tax=Solanum commersonii TaxID=4109 RepID=A0A9J5XYH6_SOLCO|nr:hypothetical protein H5410_043455 [Solanum commersonii]
MVIEKFKGRRRHGEAANIFKNVVKDEHIQAPACSTFISLQNLHLMPFIALFLLLICPLKSLPISQHNPS